MKGELEDSVKALDFDHTIILRPGLIVGSRGESRKAEFVVRSIAQFAGMFGHFLKDPWAQVRLQIRSTEYDSKANLRTGRRCYC